MQGDFTQIKNPDVFVKAMACARGCYQRNLLRGIESLSGSTLRGKALSYKARYMQSKASLLSRLTACGVAWTEIRADHGKRVLVLG